MLHKPGSRFRRVYMTLLFLFGTPIKNLIPVGATIVVLGELLVLLSYGTLKRTQELATNGVYAVTRNPVYAGAILANIGFFILAGAGLAGISHLAPKAAILPYVLRFGTVYVNPIVLIVGVTFLIFIIHHFLRRIKNEEKKLSEVFGESYAEYQKRVPTRLLPYPPAFGRMDWLLFTFSMETAFKNRVFSRVLKYGIWLVLFLGKEALIHDIHEFTQGNFKCLYQHQHFWVFVGFLLGFILLHIVAWRLQDRFESYRNR
ncbi:MAG: hypothetical protein N2234_03280 [Planctomycetota bacterium]|nr:hypothetical protein [Planctomycetota bacterium]